SGTEEERDQERREGRDLENRETDKENREILDRNGGQTARYLEQWETINMKDFIQQGFTLQWKDNQSINNLQRQLEPVKFRETDEEAKEYKIILEEELKENIVIPIKKEQIKCRLPLQDARFDPGKTDDQTWGLGHFTGPHLRISPPNSPSRITTIPSIRVPKQPLHIQSNAIWNQTLTNILCNSNGTNNVTNMNESRDQNNQLRRRYPSPPPEQGISKEHDLIEKSKTVPNQTVTFQGWECNLANATVKTKPKKRLLLLHDLYNMRRWIMTGIEITVKQTAKLIGKLNYLRLQFQEASLFLNTMDHQKAQAARLRGWNTTMIMNKTAIPDINWWITKLRANIPAQLIQIPPQMTMTIDAAPSGWGSTLEKELEMIAIAHGTWNKRQAKLSSNNREIKATTQVLRNFA
ncbi:MAG: hypothetical protein EZS28_046064, partial [Streblomastix strix]